MSRGAAASTSGHDLVAIDKKTNTASTRNKATAPFVGHPLDGFSVLLEPGYGGRANTRSDMPPLNVDPLRQPEHTPGPLGLFPTKSLNQRCERPDRRQSSHKEKEKLLARLKSAVLKWPTSIRDLKQIENPKQVCASAESIQLSSKLGKRNHDCKTKAPRSGDGLFAFAEGNGEQFNHIDSDIKILSIARNAGEVGLELCEL
mmetsp:Transcript_29832/g.60983  ORF Transcript_29832/g.60983 Transcript_29832/m.60983 type:complete len:202 (+) Transcript_29832:749-1354(+)